MKLQKKWKYLSDEAANAEEIQRVKQIANSDLLARLLFSRGINTEKKAKEYLDPLKMEFTSPYDFCDMEKAVERILKAVENKEFILIHGDFDADGITSTALLSKVMTLLGANYDIYIPNRETESHGLSTKAILKMRAKNALKLVITCDCATNDVKEIQLLNSLKIDTIVTDHHEASQDSKIQTYGRSSLQAHNQYRQAHRRRTRHRPVRTDSSASRYGYRMPHAASR